MFVLGARDQIKAMPQDQKKAFRQGQVRKLVSMSSTDRQRFVMDLQAKWDALPQKQKTQMEKRMARQAERTNQQAAQ